MTLGEREGRLLSVVEQYQAQECRRLLEEAEGAARDLLRRAYRSARDHLHQQVQAERTRARSRIEAAKAALATRERRHIEGLHWQLLEAAWPGLREALLQRWQAPEGRWAWVLRAVEEAQRSLPSQQWLIQHPPHLGTDEQARLRVALAPGLAEPPRFGLDATLEAGLLIRSGNAVLDATLDGLLADRRRLEARLLGLLQRGGEA
jgi:hypothetical protein